MKVHVAGNHGGNGNAVRFRWATAKATAEEKRKTKNKGRWKEKNKIGEEKRRKGKKRKEKEREGRGRIEMELVIGSNDGGRARTSTAVWSFNKTKQKKIETWIVSQLAKQWVHLSTYGEDSNNHMQSSWAACVRNRYMDVSAQKKFQELEYMQTTSNWQCLELV